MAPRKPNTSVLSSGGFKITYKWVDDNGTNYSSTVTGSGSATGEDENTSISNLHKTLSNMILQCNEDMQSQVTADCTAELPCSGNPERYCCVPYTDSIQYNYNQK